MRRLLFALAFAAGCASVPRGDALQRGDLLLAGGNAIEVYRGGTHLRTLHSSPGTAGMGALLTTPAGTVWFVEGDRTVSRMDGDRVTTLGREFRGVPTLAVDRSGNLFVAEHIHNEEGVLWMFDRDGRELRSWKLDALSMDLDGPCTLVFIESHRQWLSAEHARVTDSVSRHNVCMDRALAPMIEELESVVMGRDLRLLPDGSVLLTTGDTLKRRARDGSVIWSKTDERAPWRMLALDPSGRTFWSGSHNTVQRYDVATGAELGAPLRTKEDSRAVYAAVIGEWRHALRRGR
jgi:hypothetical protein